MSSSPAPSDRHEDAAASKLDIIREEPCGDASPHEAHVFSYGPMHYQCPGERGAATSRVEPGADSVQLNPESAPASSAATASPRPEVESLEDLWCWLNIWGDLLHKHQARTRPDRLSTEWRKGYEQCVRDAMDNLERLGVTWETVPDETWRKWSGRNG